MGVDEYDANGYCPLVHATIELIGRRWVGVIFLAVDGGAERFSDIRDAVPGLSDRLLSQRLRELEEEDIIKRSGDGRDVRYSITPKGADLFPVFCAVSEFVSKWVVTDCTSSGPALTKDIAD